MRKDYELIAKEMLGKKFGTFLVISDAFFRGDHRFYVVRCDCGNEREINGSHLRKRKRHICKKCSCEKRKSEVINKRFGKWTVLKEVEKRHGNNNRVLLVRCDCGTERETLAHTLTLGKSTQCFKCRLKERRNK